MEFLRALAAFMGVQGGQFCCLSARYVVSKECGSCVLPTKVHIRTFQPLDLGIIKCFKHWCRKCLVQKAVCLMGLGKDTELRIIVL